MSLFSRQLCDASTQANYLIFVIADIAVSGLTLLVEHQKEHLACIKLIDDVLVWLSVGARYR